MLEHPCTEQKNGPSCKRTGGGGAGGEGGGCSTFCQSVSNGYKQSALACPGSSSWQGKTVYAILQVLLYALAHTASLPQQVESKAHWRGRRAAARRGWLRWVCWVWRLWWVCVLPAHDCSGSACAELADRGHAAHEYLRSRNIKLLKYCVRPLQAAHKATFPSARGAEECSSTPVRRRSPGSSWLCWRVQRCLRSTWRRPASACSHVRSAQAHQAALFSERAQTCAEAKPWEQQALQAGSAQPGEHAVAGCNKLREDSGSL